MSQLPAAVTHPQFTVSHEEMVTAIARLRTLANELERANTAGMDVAAYQAEAKRLLDFLSNVHSMYYQPQTPGLR